MFSGAPADAGKEVYACKFAHGPDWSARVYVSHSPPGVVEEHVARVMQHGWDARAPLTDRLAQFMQLTGAEIEGTAGACIQCASTPALLRHGSFFVNLMAQGRTPLEMAEVRGGWVRRALGIRVFVSVPRQDVADGARITCVCKQT